MVNDANRRKIPQNEEPRPVKRLDQVTRFKRRWRTTAKSKPPRTSVERAARTFADWLATKPELNAGQKEAAYYICLAFQALVVNDHPSLRRGLEDAMEKLRKSSNQ